MATNRKDRWFVLLGFTKSARENINEAERQALEEFGTDLMGLSSFYLEILISRRALREICHESKYEAC